MSGFRLRWGEGSWRRLLLLVSSFHGYGSVCVCVSYVGDDASSIAFTTTQVCCVVCWGFDQIYIAWTKEEGGGGDDE